MNNKILIIDDEKIIRDSVVFTLEEEDYELLEASNGEEGLRIYQEHHPAVVITDLRMPGMDGFEFLKQAQITPEDYCSIVVLTGHGGDEEIEESYKHGVTSFLRKPFNIYEIKGLIHNLISLNQAKAKIIQLYNVQTLLNTMMQLALESQSLIEQLTQTLQLIFDIPIFNGLQPKGGIYLMDQDQNQFNLQVNLGIPDAVAEHRQNIRHDEGLCGRSLSEKTIQFSYINDHPRADLYNETTIAGEYCIPVVAADEVLGVMNLFVGEGYQYAQEDEQLLYSVSYTLASIIQKHQ